MSKRSPTSITNKPVPDIFDRAIVVPDPDTIAAAAAPSARVVKAVPQAMKKKVSKVKTPYTLEYRKARKELLGDYDDMESRGEMSASWFGFGGSKSKKDFWEYADQLDSEIYADIENSAVGGEMDPEEYDEIKSNIMAELTKLRHEFEEKAHQKK